jgi:uncharacterized protein YciI
MKAIYLTAALIFIFVLKMDAQSKKAPEDLKTYYLVFLKKGPNRSQDSVTAAEIQKGHLAHMDKMHAEGKLDIAGPLLDGGEIRGIVILNVRTAEEAKAITEMDPAVKAGRLIAEIHPWMCKPGSVLR